MTDRAFFFEQGVIGIENTFVVTARGGVKITTLPDEIVYLVVAEFHPAVMKSRAIDGCPFIAALI